MEPLALALRGVSHRFGEVRALDDVSLTVARGERFGVMGPDGAGKSTLLRVACGLIRPDRGDVQLSGTLGYIPQRFSLYGDLSVDENIAFFARLHGVKGFAEVRDGLLALTGLAPFRDRLASRLSGGMKQKLALCCTLVHRPDVLLLDEPTTGVDPVARREFRALVRTLAREGVTVVLATPYVDEASTCDRVALVREGRVLAVGAPGELTARLGPAVPGATLDDVLIALREGAAV